ncbi:uncharacterized protein ISCGN_013512 [Ixodes scapularis]
MGCCSAAGCSNTRKKGFHLHRFPEGQRNRARNRIWQENVRRDKWKPNANSRLCEVHFDDDQYERNRDDGLKLKQSGIPTLFSHFKKTTKRKPPRPRDTANVDHQHRTLCDDSDTVPPNGHPDSEGDDCAMLSYSAYAVHQTLDVQAAVPSGMLHLCSPAPLTLAHCKAHPSAANVDHQHHTLWSDSHTVPLNGHFDSEGDDCVVMSSSAHPTDQTLEMAELQQKLAQQQNYVTQLRHKVSRVVRDVIRRCIELDIVAVTSDVESGNRAMWKEFDIIAGRYCKVSSSTPHPDDPSKRMFFLADVPHIIKNLRNLLCRSQQVVLPQEIVAASVENLFYVVRGKNPIPTPYQCKGAFRIISVLQYFKTPAHTSYSIDDGAFFLTDSRTATPQAMRELTEGTGEADPEEDLVMPSTEKSAFCT